MSGAGGDRPPWYARALLAGLRGEAGEYVRGDLEETYRTKARTRSGRRRWLVDVMVTLVLWWSPFAVRRRMRLERVEQQAGMLRDGGRDIAQGLRALARRPGFATIAILTLAVGIAAPSTIYSVVDAVLVRGLPYEDARELVVLGQTIAGREWVEGTELHALVGVSGPTFRDWRERSRTLSALEAVENRTWLVPDQGQGPYLVRAANATPGLFELLGARMHMGRLFEAGEAGGGMGNAVMILSHATWLDRAGGDPAILGKPAPGFPGTVVVGVLAEEFEPPEAVFGREGIEYWAPLDLDDQRYARRADGRLAAIGRLASGATVAAARMELSAIQGVLAREYAAEFAMFSGGEAPGAGVNLLHDQTVGSTGRTLWLFLASAFLLLLIAAMNTANLLFVRGLDRHREIAVRRALGASRWRVARVVLVESMILALAGGVVGLLLAWAGVATFVQLVPGSMPRLGEIALNGRILGIGAATSMCVGLFAGLAPALGAVRQGFVAHRTEGATEQRRGLRLRMTLVSAQLALALVLGIGATLLFRSFVNVALANPGFDPENLIAFTTSMKRSPATMNQPPWQAWDELLDEVRTIPGLQVAAASSLPFQTPPWVPAIQLREDGPEMRRPVDGAFVITPDYFGVLGARIREGRAFAQRDRPESEPVVIVNEAFAATFLPNGPVIGETIRIWEQDGSLSERQIVGIVNDMVLARVEDGPRPALYLPYKQVAHPFVWIVVRSTRDVTELAAGLRSAALRFNPVVPAPDIERLTDEVRGARAEPRFQAWLFASFACVALLLAAVGLYGTLAHAVGRRTRELGIRMAVGADRTHIFTLILREGMLVFGAGLAVGIAASVLLTRVLRGFLFGVGPLDVPTYAASSVVLALIAALAMHQPARRAARADPLRSLRMD